MWEIIIFIALWIVLPLVLVIIPLVFLFRRQAKGIRDIKALWYRVNLHYNRKAPHELRNDLVYWEKGDTIRLLAAEQSYNGWLDKNYTFKGFLEDSFIIADKKKLEEIPAYRISNYVNSKALDRMAEKENLRIESRLKSSMYAQLLDTMREQNKEIEVQIRQLNK